MHPFFQILRAHTSISHEETSSDLLISPPTLLLDTDRDAAKGKLGLTPRWIAGVAACWHLKAQSDSDL